MMNQKKYGKHIEPEQIMQDALEQMKKFKNTNGLILAIDHTDETGESSEISTFVSGGDPLLLGLVEFLRMQIKADIEKEYENLQQMST